MSKFTGLSTGLAAVYVVVPWLAALYFPHGSTWWTAAVIYPGPLIGVLFVTAIVRDLARRRYRALIAPAFVLVAASAGLVVFLVALGRSMN